MPADLNALFANKVSHVVEDSFLAPKLVDVFLKNLLALPEWQKSKVPPNIEHLIADPNNFKHLFASQYALAANNHNETAYLRQCQKYAQTWRNLTFSCGFNPFRMLAHYLERTHESIVQPAERGHLKYFPLTIRDLAEEVLPHADFGPYDGKGWVIDNVVQQIAWNIYLTEPKEGGETTVYDYAWTKTTKLDENSYGIKDLKQAIKCRFRPKAGTLILFNCRNFHSISKSSDPRIAIGGLIGKIKDNKLIAWG